MNKITTNQLPEFSTLNFEQVPTELQEILNKNIDQLDYLLAQPTFTWENLMRPLEEMEDKVHHFWSRVSHLNAVANSEGVRTAYNLGLPKLTDYYTSLSHNKALFEAIETLCTNPSFEKYTPAQQKVLKNKLRDFKLSGVALGVDDKKRFADLSQELSSLSTKFEENLLDATAAFEKHITDKKQLAGIPPHALDAARERSKEQPGWTFTLEMPSYLAIMTHAENRALREELYEAYITRASDLGPNASTWDNGPIMHEILTKRLELAKLLGFNNYSEESLATKMATSTTEVLNFLSELSTAGLTQAKKEFKTLSQFAKETLGLNNVAPWDLSFISEKMRETLFDLSQEALRPYFEEKAVLTGLFKIVTRLFSITFQEITEFDSWHPDVKLYALYNQQTKLISYCYLDLHARPSKRGGAWMDDCQIRRRLSSGEIQLPIAFITCNFSGPTETSPALLSHEEVVTLFHEFGHALQHMLTTVDYLDVSGINGIPWDAVELPSQFLENWAWEYESLKLFAKHYQTGEALPLSLFEKLKQARNFQSALQLQRQLEFALFDFLLHLNFDPTAPNQIQTILNEVRAKVSVLPHTSYNRFQHGFSHIFGGGYAAGYYSYKWAEVMACDAFSVFLEKGLFNKASADLFLTSFLEPGGSEEPAVLFKQFRGHAPRVDALLKQSGIISDE